MEPVNVLRYDVLDESRLNEFGQHRVREEGCASCHRVALPPVLSLM